MKPYYLLFVLAFFLYPSKTFTQNKKNKKPEINTRHFANRTIDEEKLDSIRSYYFSSNTDSLFSSITIYSYNTDRLVDLINQYYISQHGTDSSPFYTEELVYNSNKLLEQRIISEIDEDRTDVDTIIPETKHKYEYNQAGQKVVDCWFAWNFETMSWNLDTAFREDYRYSEGLNAHIYRYMFGLEGERIPSSITDFFYNDEEKFDGSVTRLFYNWSDQWGLSDSTVNYYNQKGQCIQNITFWYNSTDSIWAKSLSTDYTYFDDGRLESETNWMYYADTSILTQRNKYTYANNSSHTTEMIYSWNSTLNDWQKYYRYDYYYSGFTKSNDTQVGSAISIYPNPANDYIMLDQIPKGAQIIVSDVNGKVLIQTIATQNILSINDLPSGVYTIQISGGKMTQTNKLLIKQ